MSSQEDLWITHGEKIPQKYLNPYALYEFFPVKVSHQPITKQNVQANSACSKTRSPQLVHNGWTSPSSSSLVCRNPSPSLASISRPNSVRSGYSAISTKGSTKELLKSASSPSALYLSSKRRHKKCFSFTKVPESVTSVAPLCLVSEKTATRCKSAPVRPVPKEQAATAKGRASSALLSSRSASKRAWKLRTNSVKRHHNLMSTEEIHSHKFRERCKSAPLPYDFSDVNVVMTVPENGTDAERLKAMTRPLSCMPQIIQNVLNHNSLRHCCSAYQPRPKTAPESQKQFWPTARPALYQRGFVPNYIHFVKPISLNSRASSGQFIDQLSDGYEEFFDELEDNDEVTPNLPFMRISENGPIQTELYEDQLQVSPSDYLYPPERGDNEDVGEELEISSLVSREEVSNTDDMCYEAVDKERSSEESTYMKLDQHLIEAVEGDRNGDEHVSWKLDQQFIEDGFNSEPQFEMKCTVTRKNNDMNNESDVLEQLNTEGGLACDNITQTKDSGSNSSVSEAQATNLLDDDVEENQGSILFSENLESLRPSTENNSEPSFTLEQLNRSSVEGLPQYNVSSNGKEPGDEVWNEMLTSSSTKGLSLGFPAAPCDGPQVKLLDSIVVTSYTPPKPREETASDTPKSILKLTKDESKPKPKLESMVNKPATFNSEQQTLPEKETRPSFERRDADIKRQRKPNPKLEFLQPKLSEKKEEPETLTNEVRPSEQSESFSERVASPETVSSPPEFVSRPGAYKMYEPQTLLQYHLEYPKEKRQPKRAAPPTNMPVTGVGMSTENLAIMNSVLEEQKRKKEGVKPWLQGRLALSKQTSRFELPMDVKTLESMTVMEYLTRYCMISSRRKALYKNAFLKVDKNRDGKISYKEMEKGLKDVHVDSINKEQIKKIAEMVEADSSTQLTLKEFSAVAAFSERLLYYDFISLHRTEETNSGSSMKDIIEEADFCGLKWKLNGFKVDPKLKKIFGSL